MNYHTAKICLSLFILVLFLTAIDVHAVDVRGSRSCGTWLEERQRDKHQYAEAWLVGFLSGMAFESDKDFLSGTDNASLDAWMDNYCRRNPLQSMYKGAEGLMMELIRQKGL